MRRISLFFLVILSVLGGAALTMAQDAPFVLNGQQYDIGQPTLRDVFIDPLNGDDDNDGSSASPWRTLDHAWIQLPMGETLTEGVRMILRPGVFTPEMTPNYWESRYGTYDAPIIITSEAGAASVTLPTVNIFDVTYLYLMDLTIAGETDNVFHCERCDHLLLRGMVVRGADPETYASKEAVKVNQSQWVFIENSDISGAWDNAVDMVAVQHGHLLDNQLHNAGDWCAYVKGGSFDWRIERNRMFDCGTGGFTAGQGTGFEFMVAPWLHYEAYNVVVVNNLIYDIDGGAFGVNGGYNVLFAYNTAYRVGARSHLIEVGHGIRSCDGDSMGCAAHLAAGGWGPAAFGVEEFTPSQHVYLINNVIFNPPGYQSQWQQFAISGERTSEIGSNIPSPARVDTDLVIAGNLIFNGSTQHPLGIEDGGACETANPTCNIDQLRRDNGINTLVPELTDPANGDFRLRAGVTFTAASIPDFVWDLPFADVPTGQGRVTIDRDYNGVARSADDLPGALISPSDVAIDLSAPLDDSSVTGDNGDGETVSISGALPTPGALISAPSRLPAGALALITLGDSLTQGDGDDRGVGYPGRLIGMIEDLRPGSTLLNLGQSGWSSDALITGDQGLEGQLARALAGVQAAQAAGQLPVVLIWIGSNDLWYAYDYGPTPMTAQAEADDLLRYAANLDRIIGDLTEAGALVGVALLDDQSQRPVALAGIAFPSTPPEELTMMSAHIGRYNAMLTQLAGSYGALVVDFYTTTIFTDAATLADDGNHPNGTGYDVIAARWFEVLAPLLHP